MGGFDAVDEIRREFPSARIVVLTTYSGGKQATRAFKASAFG
jgi:DNA-binding NarL/FixJ family response regulator